VDDSIVLTFEDNGIGIEKDKIGEIFSKSRRVHDKKISAEGVGIGLYLIKKIVTNAGGEIEVESKYGSGSCFTIHINEKVKTT
jgi:two-component system CheB/CheR fusion protein